MKRISVVIPSLLGKSFGDYFCVEDMIHSVLGQDIEGVDIEIILCVDKEAEDRKKALPETVYRNVRVLDSGVHGPEATLNAGVKFATGEYLAFGADGDMWKPKFLSTAFPLLEEVDFVSSNTLNTDGMTRKVIKISDFPKVPGWLMKRELWEKVGDFDDAYFSSDNDWLGRLGNKAQSRIHLVESLAPLDPEWIQRCRPWLWNVLACGKPRPKLMRHDDPYPLIIDRKYRSSRMGAIDRDEELRKRYEETTQKLIQKYGRIPW